MRRRWLRLGPGLVVSAAFIGPGTVTTCSLAGVRRGTGLLWALLFSTLATIVLQEAAARIGLVGRTSLGAAMVRGAGRRGPAMAVTILVVVAVGFGCAAYQGGNLTGAALGLEGLAGGRLALWVVLIALLAGGLLAAGSYRQVERVLMGLVAVMGTVFVATAVAVRPDPAALLGGLLVPRFAGEDLILVLALVGTTVVPYNLFLHASACRERWDGPGDLPAARLDTVLSIGLGGVVSAAVLVTGAALAGAGAEPDGAAALARQLAPLLGRAAPYLFGAGLFAAGLSSAITAPLAAAYAVSGTCGWPVRGRRFTAVWSTVLLAGLAGASLSALLPAGSPFHLAPLSAITLAQAANGVLLPVVAVFLLVAANNRELLGSRVNRAGANLAGGLVTLVAIALGVWGLLRTLG
jgi:Mn2+/Fe2+ NRAMP family transporter